jgi:methylase of polypeptide subunit release factors
MPMDKQEMDRIDLAHAKYFMLLNKKRLLAPIDENTQKVLDLGTGTGRSSCALCKSRELIAELIGFPGIWSIDFTDEHPSAQVNTSNHRQIQVDLTLPKGHRS